jgi:tripartite-type tricarboxylate transporter receptor subunit TctC
VIRTGLAAIALVMGFAIAAPAHAQLEADYPKALVKIIVPFGAGGPSDVLARVVAHHLQEAFGQPVIVEDRPGAGGTLASAQVVESTPDGLTLIMHTSGSYVAAYLYPNVRYDPVKDLAPIINCASYPFYLVVNPSLPVKTVGELIALAKKEPNKLSYSSPGIGSAGHLLMEMFKREAGIEIVHVPYRSAPQSVTDIVSGQVSLAFDTIGTSQALVAAGKLRGLAVSSGKRSAAVPDVPTVAESGLPGFEAYLWVGLFVPAGTPEPIVAKLNVEVNKILQDAEVKHLVANIGGDSPPNTPQEFTSFIAGETAKWRRIIADVGARAE